MFRFFAVYKDRECLLFEGDMWKAISFGTEGERERFCHDLRSDKSVWKDEAVQILTFERELPWFADSEGDD